MELDRRSKIAQVTTGTSTDGKCGGAGKTQGIPYDLPGGPGFRRGLVCANPQYQWICESYSPLLTHAAGPLLTLAVESVSVSYRCRGVLVRLPGGSHHLRVIIGSHHY